MQDQVVAALVRANWTVDRTNDHDGSVDLIAYSFDGMINKYGTVAEDGTLTMHTYEGPSVHTAENILSVLV